MTMIFSVVYSATNLNGMRMHKANWSELVEPAELQRQPSSTIVASAISGGEYE